MKKFIWLLLLVSGIAMSHSAWAEGGSGCAMSGGSKSESSESSAKTDGVSEEESGDQAHSHEGHDHKHAASDKAEY